MTATGWALVVLNQGIVIDIDFGLPRYVPHQSNGKVLQEGKVTQPLKGF
jgi:hypothetical protein